MIAETDAARFVIEFTEVVLMTVPATLLVYFGYRIRKRDISRDSQWLILQWVLAGMVGVVGVITALDVHRILLGYTLRDSLVVMELLTGSGIGSLLGFAIGNNRVSSKRRGETIENQRDAFLFLNRLLRHHILNSIQLVDGYTARLENYDDADLHQIREVVRTRSKEITGLIQNVQTIVSTFTDAPQLENLNLTAMVESECNKARQVHEKAEIEVDLPRAVYVASNELITVVISNLIDNAIQHNDQPTPRVQVTVKDSERTARVRISDNGPGISKDYAEQFQNTGKTGDRGIGLYLADRVVSQHGGQLLIENRSPRGTVVTVDLPKPTAQSQTRSNNPRSTTDMDTDSTH
jgi:two-component system OmpR family sensor kinase